MAGALMIGGASAAHAALTTPSCLAKKLKEWGNLRKCQASENAKALQAKPSDVAKCQIKFDAKLAKLTSQATAASISCRYGSNLDGTATDYDTGLQWEQKTDDGSVHDKDNKYSWNAVFFANGPTPDGTAFTVFLKGTLNNGMSGDGTTTTGCFAGHCDWRLPSIAELAGILDMAAPGCGSVGPCIDESVFGPMFFSSDYWSADTVSTHTVNAWDVYFRTGEVHTGDKGYSNYVRAVRSSL